MYTYRNLPIISSSHRFFHLDSFSIVSSAGRDGDDDDGNDDDEGANEDVGGIELMMKKKVKEKVTMKEMKD
jgi:hypothetical protein